MKRVAFTVLALVGILVVLAEVVLHVASAVSPKFDYEMNHAVLIVGAILGFVGLYNLDPTGTKELTKIITDVLPKFGRRSTDAVAVPEAETTVKAIPVPGVLVPTVVIADTEKDEDIERPRFAPGGA